MKYKIFTSAVNSDFLTQLSKMTIPQPYDYNSLVLTPEQRVKSLLAGMKIMEKLIKQLEEGERQEEPNDARGGFPVNRVCLETRLEGHNALLGILIPESCRQCLCDGNQSLNCACGCHCREQW